MTVFLICWANLEFNLLGQVERLYTPTAVMCPVVIVFADCHVLHIGYSASQEDGRPDPQVPDPQQSDLCGAQQVPEVKRRRQPPCGTRSVLPATHPPSPHNQRLLTVLTPSDC